ERGSRADGDVSGIRYFLHAVKKGGGSSERTRGGGPLRPGAARPDGTTSEGASFARRRAQSCGEHACRTRSRAHDGNAGTRALSGGTRDARRRFGRTEFSRAGGNRRRVGAAGGLAEPRFGRGGARRSCAVSP